MRSENKILNKAIEERYLFKPFSKDFSLVFATQKRILSKSLKSIPEKVIEHIGSTAIHGMGGKGIVDIIVFVPKEHIFKAKKQITLAGFKYNGNWANRRHFFGKYYIHKQKAKMVHVHLTAESKELHKLVALVYYLKNNKVARKKYEILKKKASKLHWNDGERYRKFKKKILSKLAKQALIYAKKQGVVQ